eukprot:TRINITY_DN29336_c0_g1_i1.p1 TRINITY_DN29336_c0_g1~~TRINITY_DN29336_c0_g1_i1.p1  ORF type:complete len:490 (+),score=85.25 TRINITY_DN29336_c0_g1_i1:39-1508(+)
MPCVNGVEAPCDSQPGLLARIGCLVDDVKDVSSIDGLLRNGLVGRRRGPELQALTEISRAVASEPSSSGGEGGDVSAAPGFGGECRDFTELANHLRCVVEHGGWDVGVIEQEAAVSRTSSIATRQSRRLVAAGPLGMQRFRQACLVEGAVVRGWVCGHEPGGRVMRLRLFAVDVPPRDEGGHTIEDSSRMHGGGVTNGNGWDHLAPTNTGIFAILRLEDTNLSLERQQVDGDSVLFPVGTLLAARLLRGDNVDQALLRASNASCMLTLHKQAALHVRSLGVIGSLALPTATEEWPTNGIAQALTSDPRFSNASGLDSRLRALALRHLHGTLLPEARGVLDRHGSLAAESLGAELSRMQGRKWADRRVRDGVAKARTGDQKAALERYDAALDLCPQHKEGLVARGAALTNVGRLKEALQDFEDALKLDPADANALRYREICRKRAREETGAFGGGVGSGGLGIAAGGHGAESAKLLASLREHGKRAKGRT